jgi:hypothetical protein
MKNGFELGAALNWGPSKHDAHPTPVRTSESMLSCCTVDMIIAGFTMALNLEASVDHLWMAPVARSSLQGQSVLTEITGPMR